MVFFSAAHVLPKIIFENPSFTLVHRCFFLKNRWLIVLVGCPIGFSAIEEEFLAGLDVFGGDDPIARVLYIVSRVGLSVVAVIEIVADIAFPPLFVDDLHLIGAGLVNVSPIDSSVRSLCTVT